MKKAALTQKRQSGVISILILLLLFLSACADQDVGIRYSNPNGETSSATSAIVFAGKVTEQETGRWLNEYTVIVFLNGNEVGRVESQRGEYKYSGQGVHDGLFAIKIANTYKLTAADEFFYSSGDPLTMEKPPGQPANSLYIYKWFGELKPGAIIRINVPAKQIQYTIAILPRPNTELSEDLLNYPAIINENGRVQAILTVDNTNLQNRAVSSTSQVKWNRSLTHFEGSLTEAWELYVKDQVQGLTWEQFQVEVVRNNTHLNKTGLRFQYDELYRLPSPNLVDLN